MAIVIELESMERLDVMNAEELVVMIDRFREAEKAFGVLVTMASYLRSAATSPTKGNAAFFRKFADQQYERLPDWIRFRELPCEHGIKQGDFCEACNKECKRADAEESAS